MKIDYRVKQVKFNVAADFYLAQYRVFGIWVNIDMLQIGCFNRKNATKCESLQQAHDRIDVHINNMARARDWMGEQEVIVWTSNDTE